VPFRRLKKHSIHAATPRECHMLRRRLRLLPRCSFCRATMFAASACRFMSRAIFTRAALLLRNNAQTDCSERPHRVPYYLLAAGSE